MNFCVKCGIDCDSTIDGLCLECFLDGRVLTVLPHHVDLQMCANCGEFFYGDAWIQKSKDEAIEDAAVDSLQAIKEAKVKEVSVYSEEQDGANYMVTVAALLDVQGCETESEASTIVRMKNTVCKRCSRQLGSYYESILQVRSGEKNLDPALAKEVLTRAENHVYQQSKHNREIFISKAEQVPGGIDLYLSSIQLGKSMAKHLADMYSAETKEAAKLVGRAEDGQDMYRVTYLVRLPEYHVGDTVILDGRYLYLSRVSGGGGKVVDLMNFRERSVRYTDMSRLKVHQKAADMPSAAVISRKSAEIQVLHPSNYSAIDLRIPEGAEIGDTVTVTDVDGILYYVPNGGR